MPVTQGEHRLCEVQAPGTPLNLRPSRRHLTDMACCRRCPRIACAEEAVSSRASAGHPAPLHTRGRLATGGLHTPRSAFAELRGPEQGEAASATRIGRGPGRRVAPRSLVLSLEGLPWRAADRCRSEPNRNARQSGAGCGLRHPRSLRLSQGLHRGGKHEVEAVGDVIDLTRLSRQARPTRRS